MELLVFNTREELEDFLKYDKPAAQLAKKEGRNVNSTCDVCDKKFEAIIYGGAVNYYLCYEHLVELEGILRAALS